MEDTMQQEHMQKDASGNCYGGVRKTQMLRQNALPEAILHIRKNR